MRNFAALLLVFVVFGIPALNFGAEISHMSAKSTCAHCAKVPAKVPSQDCAQICKNVTTTLPQQAQPSRLVQTIFTITRLPSFTVDQEPSAVLPAQIIVACIDPPFSRHDQLLL